MDWHRLRHLIGFVSAAIGILVFLTARHHLKDWIHPPDVPPTTQHDDSSLSSSSTTAPSEQPEVAKLKRFMRVDKIQVTAAFEREYGVKWSKKVTWEGYISVDGGKSCTLSTIAFLAPKISLESGKHTWKASIDLRYLDLNDYDHDKHHTVSGSGTFDVENSAEKLVLELRLRDSLAALGAMYLAASVEP